MIAMGHRRRKLNRIERGLHPRPEREQDFRRLRRGGCPNIECGETKVINIINLGPGFRQCRSCSTLYEVKESLRISELKRMEAVQWE